MDEGVIHVISNSSDYMQTWCTVAKNSSWWSYMWVLFLHTIARVVSEHHWNAPAFSTLIDYHGLSCFLLSLLFSAHKDPCWLRIPWISEIKYSLIRAPKCLLKFAASVDMLLHAVFSLLQSLYLSPIPRSLKPSKERGFRNIKRNITAYTV
jgi:hypothetical protein